MAAREARALGLSRLEVGRARELRSSKAEEGRDMRGSKARGHAENHVSEGLERWEGGDRWERRKRRKVRGEPSDESE